MVILAGGHILRVRVNAGTLARWWGKSVGPQDAVGIITTQMAAIEEIVADKLLAGDVGDDGIIMVSASDWLGCLKDVP